MMKQIKSTLISSLMFFNIFTQGQGVYFTRMNEPMVTNMTYSAAMIEFTFEEQNNRYSGRMVAVIEDFGAGGAGLWKNPNTGEKEPETDQWKYRWVNNLGDIIYSDRGEYDPNVDPALNVSGFKKSVPRQ